MRGKNLPLTGKSELDNGGAGARKSVAMQTREEGGLIFSDGVSNVGILPSCATRNCRINWRNLWAIILVIVIVLVAGVLLRIGAGTPVKVGGKMAKKEGHSQLLKMRGAHINLDTPSGLEDDEEELKSKLVELGSKSDGDVWVDERWKAPRDGELSLAMLAIRAKGEQRDGEVENGKAVREAILTPKRGRFLEEANEEFKLTGMVGESRVV